MAALNACTFDITPAALVPEAIKHPFAVRHAPVVRSGP